MKCEKCNKGSCILVTEQNKKMQGDRKGLIRSLIGIIIWVPKTLWKVLFGKKEKYQPKQVWKCNYCGVTFKDKGGDPEIA
ncbi:MAG: hypothetical protein FWD32_00115 [Firmicutes bacterium]|nr:hypothetical protein [Bacillota bacterium]